MQFYQKGKLYMCQFNITHSEYDLVLLIKNTEYEIHMMCKKYKEF